MRKHLTKEQVKKQYIKDLIRSSKEILAGFTTPEEAKNFHANLWFDQYHAKHNDFSSSELLNPIHEQLRFGRGMPSAGNKVNLVGYNGLWRIFIHPRSRKSLDFDISVKAGSTYRFHSKVIKHSIVSRHGHSCYEQWRKLVRDDISSLKTLVQEVRSRISSVAWSYTCSQSSANLCEQVGVSTYRGTAFLFPDSFD